MRSLNKRQVRVMKRPFRVLGLLAFVLLFGPLTMADEHWSFRKTAVVEPPAREALQHALRVRNPIDQFVLHRLEESGLEPAPVADRVTLVRRAYFDLLGLPPSPEQVDAFVKNDADDVWPNLIDELLSSKYYGERWGRHWLDVARYADSGGYETDMYYRNAWRYRDYVVKSFNDDKPYNIFVQEQIAGDELWPDNLDLDPRRVYVIPEEKRRHLEARIGTGFYALYPQVHESALDAKRLRYETVTDWVDNTAAAFMGVTLGCARCHEHKFDPFTQEDYFALHAIFASARPAEHSLLAPMQWADWQESYPWVMAVVEARTAYQLFEKRTASKTLTPEEEQEKRDLLAAIGEAVLKIPRGEATLYGPYDGLFHVPSASVLARQHPALIPDVHLLVRGELHKPGELMQPALPAVLAKTTGTPAELPTPFGSRKQFALWLTRPDHPLTARVMVNRIWQWHFGRGIVETPNDFGLNGQPRSHPELLDWLATHFVEGGWKIKTLHRLIMNSATYRQSSNVGEDRYLEVDPNNKLLWRMNRRRLEGEALWDSVHTAAATINLAMGGPPVVPPLVEDEIASLRKKWQWVVSADPAQHTRRGLYIMARRNFKFPMFDVFDAPVDSVSCPTRDVTTVAPQALWGLNNHSVVRQAENFAARVVKEAGEESGAQVDRAWRIALGRPPSERELASAVELMRKLEADDVATCAGDSTTLDAAVPASHTQALSKLCLALFNLSEFAFVD